MIFVMIATDQIKRLFFCTDKLPFSFVGAIVIIQFSICFERNIVMNTNKSRLSMTDRQAKTMSFSDNITTGPAKSMIIIGRYANRSAVVVLDDTVDFLGDIMVIVCCFLKKIPEISLFFI